MVEGFCRMVKSSDLFTYANVFGRAHPDLYDILYTVDIYEFIEALSSRLPIPLGTFDWLSG